MYFPKRGETQELKQGFIRTTKCYSCPYTLCYARLMATEVGAAAPGAQEEEEAQKGQTKKVFFRFYSPGMGDEFAFLCSIKDPLHRRTETTRTQTHTCKDMHLAPFDVQLPQQPPSFFCSSRRSLGCTGCDSGGCGMFVAEISMILPTRKFIASSVRRE